MNKFSKEKFEQVAAENGYEVFTTEDIASYYKDGIQKSLNEQMSENEKKEFVADCMSLAKAVLVDGEGKESTVYYRKSQVNWEKAEDGTIMKGVAGVYADTPTNRLLGRVGEAYVPDEEFMKSLENDTEDSIAKAARTGRYADTPENRRLHRVGQPYKKRAGKGGAEGDDRKPAGKGEKKGGLDEKTLKDAWASIRTVDDEGTWDDALREHLGDDAADSVYNEDGDLNPKKMFNLIKKLPADVVKRCIKEVGMEPEDGDQPMPGESGSKSDGKKDGEKKEEKKGGELKKDAWNENISANQLPEKYRKFTEDALSSLREKFGATNLKLDAYVSSSESSDSDDTEISIEGKIDGHKFEVSLYENGSGSIGVGSNSDQFKDIKDMVATMNGLRDDMDWDDDDDDDDDDKKKE